MNIKYLSRQNIIDLFVSLFPNKKTLDKFQETSDGNLSYDGKQLDGLQISSEDNNAIQNKEDGLFIEDFSSNIKDLEEDSHKHNNLEILNLFTEDNGVLKYKGAQVKTPINVSKKDDNILEKLDDGLYVSKSSTNSSEELELLRKEVEDISKILDTINRTVIT